MERADASFALSGPPALRRGWLPCPLEGGAGECDRVAPSAIRASEVEQVQESATPVAPHGQCKKCRTLK
eukprot:scaffold84278_cov35-Tisochrysis_lutea.AAC.9